LIYSDFKWAQNKMSKQHGHMFVVVFNYHYLPVATTAPPHLKMWTHAQNRFSFRAKHWRGPGESLLYGFDWTPQPKRLNMLISHWCVDQSTVGFHSERSLLARKDTQQYGDRHEVVLHRVFLNTFRSYI